MLRLAHRIMQGPIFDPTGLRIIPDNQRWIMSEISKANVVLAQSVADLVEAEIQDGKLDWMPSDTPCCRFPWDRTFVEWIEPKHVEDDSGIHQFGVMVQQFTEPTESGDELVLQLGCFAWSRINQRTVFIGSAEVHADLAGNVLCQGERNEYFKNFTAVSWSVPALMTASFLNCKNIVPSDGTQENGPSDKWLRRQKLTKLKYHVLNIEPMKQVLRTEGGLETNGLKKALHICRGHFKTYTADAPLFGKFTGTVWCPQHAKGNAKEGIVLKDYKVSAPKVAAPLGS